MSCPAHATRHSPLNANRALTLLPLPLPPANAVDLDTVQGFATGLRGGRMARFVTQGGASQAAAALLAEERRKYPCGDVVAGWLDKFGGAHGGKKGWQRRWFVLSGANLLYFASPRDGKPKGMLDLTGSGTVVGAAEGDERSIELSWPAEGAGAAGQDEGGGARDLGVARSADLLPSRELRADSVADRDRWLAAIKAALRVDRLLTGVGLAGRAGGAAGAGAASPTEFAPPATQTVPAAGAVSISFSVSGGGAAAAKEPAALFCGSLLSFERWYFGLQAVVAQRQRLSLAAQEARHRAAVAADPGDVAAKVALALALERRGTAPAKVEAMQLAAAAQAASPGFPLAAKLAGRLLLGGGCITAANVLLQSRWLEGQVVSGESLSG